MDKIKAKNGKEFLIRPIQKEDKIRLVIGLSKMSQESIHHRFLGFKKGFSEKELRQLTELDGKRHFALAVGTLDEKNELQGIGVGRYHAINESGTIAEVAITILDDFQGLGLGTILMKKLIKEAKENGFDTFEGILENTNDPMKALIKKLEGFKTIRTEEGELKMLGDLSSY